MELIEEFDLEKCDFIKEKFANNTMVDIIEEVDLWKENFNIQERATKKVNYIVFIAEKKDKSEDQINIVVEKFQDTFTTKLDYTTFASLPFGLEIEKKEEELKF